MHRLEQKCSKWWFYFCSICHQSAAALKGRLQKQTSHMKGDGRQMKRAKRNLPPHTSLPDIQTPLTDSSLKALEGVF